MNKLYYTYTDLHDAATDIALQMYKDAWRPDYIVGLNRGGLPLALRLSHILDVNMYALDVRLRDGSEGPESNLWMAEDAFGYVEEKDRDDVWSKSRSNPSLKKNILIVDDINDTGATFEWIKQDWQSSCMPNNVEWSKFIWGNNVRFATMFEKTHTNFDGVQYNWKTVDTSEGDPWIVFPWEYDK